MQGMAERAREGETHEILDHPLRLELWEFSKTAVKRLEIKTSFQLETCVGATIASAKAELQEQTKWFDGLKKHQQQRLAAKGQLPRAQTGRWFHMAGCSASGTETLAAQFCLDDEVLQSIAAAVSKPSVDWHQNPTDPSLNYLFITGHYIEVDPDMPGDEDGEGIKAFHFEQVCILFFPDLNIFLSIDGNGSRNWDSVTMCINNDRCFLRTSCDVSTLIYKLVDAMIDGVYPLLDVYGDTIENLEFVMMISDEPTDEHVRSGYKLQRRVHSLRRYAWNARDVLQELRQDNFGVIPPNTSKMLVTIERNAENMVEVAAAYMEQCSGIEEFYEGFQEKLQNKTLYFLTIVSVGIMPYQLLTGMFGMNFEVAGDSSGSASEMDGPVPLFTASGIFCDTCMQDPMLRFRYGQLVFFWVFGGFLTALCFIWMHRKGILKSRSTSWTSAITSETLGDEAQREDNLKRFRSASTRADDKSIVAHQP